MLAPPMKQHITLFAHKVSNRILPLTFTFPKEYCSILTKVQCSRASKSHLHEIWLLIGELAVRGTELTLNARLGTENNLLIEQDIRRTPLYQISNIIIIEVIQCVQCIHYTRL